MKDFLKNVNIKNALALLGIVLIPGGIVLVPAILLYFKKRSNEQKRVYDLNRNVEDSIKS